MNKKKIKENSIWQRRDNNGLQMVRKKTIFKIYCDL